MSLSIYRASVPVFVRGMTVLADLLEKAVAHAQAEGLDPASLVNARLAPDMYPLSGQIQRASDAAKFAVQRLSQGQAPKFPDEETTFAQLQQRIADTIAYLQSVTPEQVDGAESRKVVVNFGDFKPEFTGEDYLLTFALPNFYFHVTTAYAILRNAGVKIGKLDFLGPYSQ
ncbi:hypothetical protein CEY09_13150 [Achromobacter marplatensis]|jgi:hypothetical protein|uniref:DUF1993 domain-containing protein n=2 Tax=Achromobacter marplatensis TaxID=470868 RepID=A0AA42WHC8_9BURK|nr:DUF1993 domain-containing protein [Achromobacter marplatensis]MDH2054236.1 DUF1993 domain-containing protein [Achromobacter marplatensis]OWT67477.1 hypothetical protein CEY09_13150 [Achromobacter marplatensis]RBP20083.1 hypothetical protein DFP87_104423 [Achromobacter marplatensis]CAB3634695.1 hypothetical protein LMG26219_01466 [Achromobacter marplatensis]